MSLKICVRISPVDHVKSDVSLPDPFAAWSIIKESRAFVIGFGNPLENTIPAFQEIAPQTHTDNHLLHFWQARLGPELTGVYRKVRICYCFIDLFQMGILFYPVAFMAQLPKRSATYAVSKGE